MVEAGAATGCPPFVRLLPDAVAGFVDSTYPLSQPSKQAAAINIPTNRHMLRVDRRMTNDVGNRLSARQIASLQRIIRGKRVRIEARIRHKAWIETPLV